MRFYEAGDKTKALCEDCGAVVEAVYGYHDVAFDDGVGIADDGVGRRSGVANIDSRALELGGTCRLERVSRDGGTRLTWRVPLDA